MFGEGKTCVRWFCRLLAGVFLSLSFWGIAIADDFLDPAVAFKVDAKMVGVGQLRVTFKVADGYYLYREQFKFEALGAELGRITLPPGNVKFDENFGKDVATFHYGLELVIPVKAAGDFKLKVRQQGCADAGLCYPPMDLVLPVVIDPALATKVGASAEQIDAPASAAPALETEGESSIEQALSGGSFLVILPLFLLLGVGLSLTPCVLPMVPILSFIIVGEGVGIRRSRSFLLSLSYVMGMALVYTALGVAAGLAGEGLSAALQKPSVLLGFAGLMLILSLSMFGVIQVQMPSALQTKLTYFSEGQRKGKMAGVFVMGAISALIVGPCVAAPLAGALVYISQTKNVLVGALALFSLAMGMGVPLLLLGLSAGSLLPRAGVWMEQIKRFFGVLMVAMAIWIASPLLSGLWQMLAWGSLMLAYGSYLGFFYRGGAWSKFLAVVLLLAAASQFIGLASGGREILRPFSHWTGEVQGVKFERIRTSAELDLALANSGGKVVMLDFYADWCISCKEMEKLTFVKPAVAVQMDQMRLLQVDVTENNADDKALLKRFGLFGPPGIIFFDAKGAEISGGRVIGYQNEEKFLKSLARVASHRR